MTTEAASLGRATTLTGHKSRAKEGFAMTLGDE